MADSDRLCRRQRHQAQGCLGDDHERPLGPDDEAGEVEGRTGEAVESIAAGAPPVPRKAFRNRITPFLDDRWQTRVDPALQRVRACAASHLGVVDGCERRRAGVAEHHLERLDMIDGHAVHDRSAASRVVADHAANCRAVARRCVRSEEQAMLRRGAVEVVLDHAGLHPCGAGLSVQLQDGVHVARGVDDHRAPDRLPGQAGARTARQHRHTEPRAHRDSGGDVGRVAREHDRERLDAVHARVAREQVPGVRVRAHVPRHRGAQRRREVAYRRVATPRRCAITSPA